MHTRAPFSPFPPPLPKRRVKRSGCPQTPNCFFLRFPVFFFFFSGSIVASVSKCAAAARREMRRTAVCVVSMRVHTSGVPALPRRPTACRAKTKTTTSWKPRRPPLWRGPGSGVRAPLRPSARSFKGGLRVRYSLDGRLLNGRYWARLGMRAIHTVRRVGGDSRRLLKQTRIRASDYVVSEWVSEVGCPRASLPSGHHPGGGGGVGARGARGVDRARARGSGGVSLQQSLPRSPPSHHAVEPRRRLRVRGKGTVDQSAIHAHATRRPRVRHSVKTKPPFFLILKEILLFYFNSMKFYNKICSKTLY